MLDERCHVHGTNVPNQARAVCDSLSEGLLWSLMVPLFDQTHPILSGSKSCLLGVKLISKPWYLIGLPVFPSQPPGLQDFPGYPDCLMQQSRATLSIRNDEMMSMRHAHDERQLQTDAFLSLFGCRTSCQSESEIDLAKGVEY